MVQGLGYSITNSSDGTYFWVTVSTQKYNIEVNFQLSSDTTIIYVYAFLSTLTSAQLQKLDWLGMMVSNNATPNYFGIAKNTNPVNYSITMNFAFPNQSITPQELRSVIDSLTNEIGKTDNLWNTELWK